MPDFNVHRINDDIFALVPFLDMANHSDKPNANFRLNGECLKCNTPGGIFGGILKPRRVRKL